MGMSVRDGRADSPGVTEGAVMRGPVGILGGTFDPVHVGHLRLAIEVRERLGLETVHLVPLNSPPHRRTGPRASPAMRLDMLKAALPLPRGLMVNDREVLRGGISYTYDTLLALRAEWPGVSLCLILGQDAFSSLPTWHRWTELSALTHMVVVGRPGSTRELPPVLEAMVLEKRLQDPARLRQETAGGVYFLDCPQLAVSSSSIREMIAAGRNVRFLVPDAVLQLIEQHQLYLTQTA